MTRKYLAPAFLATSSLDTENAISQYEGSILLIHGRRDGVIPVSHGRRLAKAARQVTYVELPCGHNDLRTADSAAYWSTITDFTRRVIPNLP
jgi:pimeloyl-ACP methyl ester carboxylesterase